MNSTGEAQQATNSGKSRSNSESAERIKRNFERRAANVKPEDEEQVASSLQGKITSIVQSAETHRPFSLRLISRVKLLWAMLRDKTFELEWTSRGTIIAALLYFIAPFDVLPDVLPIIGIVDDAFVLSLVFSQLNSELERFTQHLRNIIAQSDQNGKN